MNRKIPLKNLERNQKFVRLVQEYINQSKVSTETDKLKPLMVVYKNIVGLSQTVVKQDINHMRGYLSMFEDRYDVMVIAVTDRPTEVVLLTPNNQYTTTSQDDILNDLNNLSNDGQEN